MLRCCLPFDTWSCSPLLINGLVLQSPGQFAVIHLHRDAFSAMVRWEAGDAMNVMDDSYWHVDEEAAIPAGQGNSDTVVGITDYYWYRHSIPIWPLPNQTLQKPTRRFSFRLGRFVRRPEWPNYALATPLYLVPYERSNFRDPIISMNKVFHKLKHNKQRVFVKPLKFIKYVRECTRCWAASA